MNYNRLSIFFLIFALCLISSACKPQDIGNSNAGTSEDAFGYPILEEFNEVEVQPAIAYPIQEEIYSEPVISEIPMPSEGVGIIYGRLLSLSMDQPISYSKIYLGTKIKVDPGDEYIISIQDNASPHTISTQNGEFLIIDIPPDEYILTLVTPINTYPVLDSNSEYIELAIKGGERIDLGDVFAIWPDFD